MDAKRNGWDELTQSQRNCLMWPDFLEWGDPVDKVEIQRQHSEASLGLVSVTVQDQSTKQWYNISKRVKENCPAQGNVDLYKWIFEVNDKDTNIPSEEFSKLFKNEKKKVCLSLKTAVDPLSKFTKKWLDDKKENIVTLKLNEGNTLKERLKLVHFYSKGENGKKYDHILVWEIKPGEEPSEISEPLYRGDELLAVNDVSVGEKKLAEIYDLIFHQIPSEVKLKMRKIERVQCNGEGMEPPTFKPEIEQPLNTPDTEEKNVPQNDTSTQCLIVEKEMNEYAGRDEKTQREGYENPIVKECEGGSHSAVTETAVNSEETPTLPKTPEQENKSRKPRLSSIRRRLSIGSSHGGNNKVVDVEKNENPGYKGTPPPERKFSPTSDKMCQHCVMKSETQLSDDRNEWPINKIELATLEEIWRLLDLDDPSKKPLLSALGCFDKTEADSIRQEFRNGKGLSKKALDRWGASDRRNNVGALKKIVESTMERVDVLAEIEKWEKLSVCYGCSIRLKR